jgi:hypothetical protein
MNNFYITLPSDSSGYYLANTIVNFTTELATPLELEPYKWEVSLVQISYPNRCRKRFRHNTIPLDSQYVIFPVKDYESMLDPMTNIPYLLEPCKQETFEHI